MSEKKYQHSTPKLERRTMEFEVKEGSEGRVIVGHAVVFNEWADMGWYRELVEPGAFTEVLKRSDTRALFNHDPNFLLGREKSGTLQIEEDRSGLYMTLELPKSRPEVLESVQRRDLDGCSYQYRVAENGDHWSEEIVDGKVVVSRRIKEVNYLKDVCLATFPAFEQTTAEVSPAKRSYQEWKGEDDEAKISHAKAMAQKEFEEEQRVLDRDLFLISN